MEQPATATTTVKKYGIGDLGAWILYTDGTLIRFPQFPQFPQLLDKRKGNSDSEEEEEEEEED
jgi:hypothetical protein